MSLQEYVAPEHKLKCDISKHGDLNFTFRMENSYDRSMVLIHFANLLDLKSNTTPCYALAIFRLLS